MNPFFFGKLPAFGDFVSRGLSAPMMQWWDAWCSDAVRGKPLSAGVSGLRYDANRPDIFRIEQPAVTGSQWQAGCIAPSNDRVGRVFPFVAGITSATPIDAGAAAAIGEQLAVSIGTRLERHKDLDAVTAAVLAAARYGLSARRPPSGTTAVEERCLCRGT